MYVDKGRWTYPDLVPLRAAKLEIKECWSQRPTVNKCSVGSSQQL